MKTYQIGLTVKATPGIDPSPSAHRNVGGDVSCTLPQVFRSHVLAPEERQNLNWVATSTIISAGLARREEIILLLADWSYPICSVAGRLRATYRGAFVGAKRFLAKVVWMSWEGLTHWPRRQGAFFPPGVAIHVGAAWPAKRPPLVS